jgi:hypothetical protein
MRRQTLTELARNPNLISGSTIIAIAGVNGVRFHRVACFTQPSKQMKTTPQRVVTFKTRPSGANSARSFRKLERW